MSQGRLAQPVSRVTEVRCNRVKTIAAIVGMLSVASLTPAYSQRQPATAWISDQKVDQAAAAARFVSLTPLLSLRRQRCPVDFQ
jgi:hypothetical protein